MPLYITEHAYLAKDLDGKYSDNPVYNGINHTAYAITTASRNSVTFRSSTRFVSLIAQTASVVSIGAGVDASSSGTLLPANIERIFGVAEHSGTVHASFKMFV